MNTDPIADLLTRIRNATKADHQDLTVPYSKIKESVLKVLEQYGFIDKHNTETEGQFKVLRVVLKEERRNINLKRVSSPGQRIYIKSGDIKRIKNGLGIGIMTTARGVMSTVEARKQNLGGELICEVY